jgi:molecular chaperone HtpG
MSEIGLTSKAESQALIAEDYYYCGGIKLLHIKRQVALIAGMIGRGEIFDEYTKHDISHIDYMLNSLDFIIPKETSQLLTPTDWLMITLSIYFHDLGMLVTKSEFANRASSSFPNFKQSVLDSKYGVDFKDKILGLHSAKQDRFLYQEFVRKTHAERIKFWLLGEKLPGFDAALPIAKEIQNLIGGLDSMFKNDLATICESHHLSDLEDLSKYRPDQQYGPSASEKVNLHYCALILRTADLLHITSDRTPNIEYYIINPSDPISQDEWAKQRAVRAIRPQVRKNKEDVYDEQLLK